MDRLFAAHRFLHVNGMAPWVESACAPSYTADDVRPSIDGGVAARFGGGNGQIVGQSYDRGIRRLR